ncbi:MAG: hypothetical protein IIA83_00660 [Thaumarchaeota archaeon]|nr:hypothetical protein [Nitrososphaerota archaeon]
MVRPKKDKPMDIKLKIAIIVTLGAVAAGALQGPFMNSVYQDRPIVDISLGQTDGSLPTEELQHDGKNYYVEFAMKNRGLSDGKIFVSIFADNADISFIENGPYQKFAQLSHVVFPNAETKISKFYLIPHDGMEKITFTLGAEKDTDASFFQELNTFIPLELTYEKSEDKYVLTDKR